MYIPSTDANSPYVVTRKRTNSVQGTFKDKVVTEFVSQVVRTDIENGFDFIWYVIQ